MNNNITNWSYDKPTEEGLYLICNGDIEVQENIEAVTMQRIDGVLMANFKDGAFFWVSEMNSKFKYAKLCFGSESKDEG